jgi:hypothetical protein
MIAKLSFWVFPPWLTPATKVTLHVDQQEGTSVHLARTSFDSSRDWATYQVKKAMPDAEY